MILRSMMAQSRHYCQQPQFIALPANAAGNCVSGRHFLLSCSTCISIQSCILYSEIKKTRLARLTRLISSPTCLGRWLHNCKQQHHMMTAILWLTYTSLYNDNEHNHNDDWDDNNNRGNNDVSDYVA